MQFEFNYATAFSRNLGWVTAAEQNVLRHKRIAIAGLGGVGGSHVLTLTRLGIGAFHLADMDRFELANFNRQAGASVSSLDRPKTEVVAELARDINPELDVRLFQDGVNADNVEAFLQDIDVYVDGLDFFALAARRAVFAACAERGIPAVTAAPLGMGAALLVFVPGGMSFEDYFRLEGQPKQEQLLRFLLGLSPSMLQAGYLADPDAVDLPNRRTPSTPMGCELAAGLAATQVLKLLLNRGKITAAPHGLHFDAYRNRLVRTWRPGGNRHPLQRLGLAIARRRFGAMSRPASASTPESTPGSTPAAATTTATSAVERILEQARWAPSGDNSQPWRFEMLGADHIRVHGFDTRSHCVYDLQGHASQLSLGALLETLDIAASGEQLSTHIERDPDALETAPVFDIHLSDAPRREPDPLLPYIPIRQVQRQRLRTTPLNQREKAALEAAVGSDYSVAWFEGWRERWRMARLWFRNAGLRLTLPEAYPTHRDIIDWSHIRSEDRIPAKSLGASPLTLFLMRWALKRWNRVRFLNRYLAGTLMPRVEMDLLPALGCGAHFALVAAAPPQTIDDYVAAGRATQRFWLTAARLGLLLQPAYTPLVFHEYVQHDVDFTAEPGKRQQAAEIAAALERQLGADTAGRTVFLGRIGHGTTPTSRSVRQPLAALLQPAQE